MACNLRAVNARELGPGISVFSRMLAMSIPSNRLFVQIDINLLGLEILVNAMDPQLPAEARLLKASPRRFYARRLHMINPHHTSADGLNHAHGTIDIARPDGCGQSERGVVGNLERLALVLEWDHADHRAKDLFPRNPRRVIDVVIDRRLDIITAGQRSRPAAAQRQLGF